jgi:fused signal recognition particle receptor
MAIFKGLIKGLEKTKKQVTSRIFDIVKSLRTIDEDFFEELEDILITSDIGVKVTGEILDHLRMEAKKEKIKDTTMLIDILKSKLKDILKDGCADDILERTEIKKIILVVGVNGVGKTTSIGKIAYLFKKKGFDPLIAAADTFRAAAVDQLQIWANRADCEIIRQAEGADPSSVIYDAISYMKKHGNDVLLCDTAGRLHNKKNLMNELKKVYSTIEKNAADTKIYTLLVIDASTGQNGVNQAALFKEACNVDGVILTKIDGTARGGIIFPIAHEIDIPVLFIGVGEKIDDLDTFDPDDFVDALFE